MPITINKVFFFEFYSKFKDLIDIFELNQQCQNALNEFNIKFSEKELLTWLTKYEGIYHKMAFFNHDEPNINQIRPDSYFKVGLIQIKRMDFFIIESFIELFDEYFTDKFEEYYSLSEEELNQINNDEEAYEKQFYLLFHLKRKGIF